MPHYTTVLAAIDLTEESRQVLEKARDLAGGSPLSVIYVSQPLAQLYGGEIGMSLGTVEADLQKQANDLLAARVKDFDVTADRQHVAIGNPAAEIRRVAAEISANLIVIGTHSRHGLGLLLGSTANGVLHGTSCDVLAVRIDTGG